MKRDLKNDKSVNIEDILSEDISVSVREKKFIKSHLEDLK